MKSIVVQKYGGATLETAEKIKMIAADIAHLYKKNTQIVVVVSAMGNTTNDLIKLAQKTSKNPNRRELDMLLTTGERVSMSLLSMALLDLDIPAISFTGSQAGIMTNQMHSNATIQDVHAFRVAQALQSGKVVVLAGFQGIDPMTKEITTLGRGGSDTTAVAMAGFLESDRCEILKEVSGVFSADPKIVKDAKKMSHLNYEQMLEMTFWGAKVLHFRSVELAKTKKVPIYILQAGQDQSGQFDKGTIIDGENEMYESSQVLAINSHSQILILQISGKDTAAAIDNLKKHLDQNEIAFPQTLLISDLAASNTKTENQHLSFFEFILTGSFETIESIKKSIEINRKDISILFSPLQFCSVTCTCTGMTSYEISQQITKKLSENKINLVKLIYSSSSITAIIEASQKDKAIQALHSLVI